MDAWMDLNRDLVKDRIRERTDAAAAHRLAAQARRSAPQRPAATALPWLGLPSRRAPSKA